jgi:hypothetical protein
MSTFPYKGAFLLDDGSEELLDLEVRGWADPARLDRTRRFTLIPNEGEALPVLTIAIPTGGKPVFKARAFGSFATVGAEGELEPAFRCYAAGYKVGRREVITWVYPTGAVEVGPEPSFAGDMLKAINDANREAARLWAEQAAEEAAAEALAQEAPTP